jgi:uncharacterized delta-60 repeat protein
MPIQRIPRSRALSTAIESLEPRRLFSAALDTSFGQGGISIQTPLCVPAGAVIGGGDIATNSDGSAIVAVGLSATDTQNHPGELLINRLDSSGKLDTTFGIGAGFLLFGSSPGATFGFSGGGIFPLAGGGFLLDLTTSDNSATDPVLTSITSIIRFDAHGVIDPTYGTDGVFVLPSAKGRDASIDSAGRVLIPGQFILPNTTTEQDAVVRVTAAGLLDTTFGNAGFATIIEPDIANNDGIRSLAVAPDNSVYVIGRETFQNLNGSDTANFYVAHLTSTGSADPNFAHGQFTELAGNYADTDPPPAVVQSDGQVVVLASVADTQGLVRLNTDGTVDNSFHFSPLTSFDITDQSARLALEPDDKLLIGGSSVKNDQDNFAVAQLNSDGAADTAFGNGFAEPGVYGTTQAQHATFIAVYPDGRLLALGGARAAQHQAYITRFLGTFVPTPIVQGPSLKVGGLDTTFGGTNGAGAGLAKVTLINFTATTAGIVTQNDGKLVVAATITPSGGGNSDFEVFRLNPDGSTDTTFGDNGFARANFPTSATATAVQLLPDGRILVVGSAADGSGSEIAIARFNSDGSLDTTLQGTGRAQAELRGAPAADIARAVLVNSDGTFYLAGSSNSDFALAKFNSDGSLAAAFHDGAVFLGLGGDDIANALVLQKDGKIVLGGSTTAPTGSTKFAAARFTSAGILDTSFGAVGKSHPGFVTLSIAGSDDEAFAAALQPDGSILLGGFTASGSLGAGNLVTRYALVRLMPTGKLDLKFAKAGKALASFPNESLASITNVSVQSISKTDFRILVSGKVATALGQPRSIALARYTSTGALDTTFATSGKTVLLQPDSAGTFSAFVAAPADSLSNQFAAFTNDAQGAVARTSSGGIRALAADNNTNSTSVFVAAVVADGVDFTGGLVVAKPSSVMGGAKTSATLNATNAGSLAAAGSMTVTLYTSLDQTFTTDDAAFSTAKLSAALAPGKSKSFPLNFAYPTGVSDGTYFIIAELNSGQHPISEINFNNNAAISKPIKITAPFVDLSGSFQSPPKSIKSGARTSVSINVANHGTANATGPVNVTLYATPHRAFTGSEPQIFSTSLPTGLKTGASKTLKLNFTLMSGLIPPGTDFLYAVLTYAGTPADKIAQNNAFFSAAPVIFS